MFDGKHGVALHSKQGNRASSHGEGAVSWFSSSCSEILGYILDLRGGWPFKTLVSTATSVLLSSYKGHLRNLLEVWHGNRDASQCEAGNHGSLSSCQRDIGIPSFFQEESCFITF